MAFNLEVILTFNKKTKFYAACFLQSTCYCPLFFHYNMLKTLIKSFL